MLRHGELLDLLLEDLAEDLGGLGELRRRELLAADHEHRVLDPGVVQGRPSRRVERPGEVDAGHLGAQGRRKAFQGEAWRFGLARGVL